MAPPPATEHAQEESGAATADMRQDWIEARMLSSLKMKKQDIKKLMDNEDSSRAVKDFFDTADATTLFIGQDTGSYVATNKSPDHFKKKAIYFLKRRSTKLDSTNLDSEVLYGDLTGGALETLSMLAREVFGPILANRSHHRDVMEIQSKDLMSAFHRFLASIYVTLGQTQGKTLLPLPAQTRDESQDENNKDFIHVLEDAVILWIKQIREVLDTDSEDLFKAGRTPGPLEEVQFWEQKAQNLNLIFEQVNSAKVQKVVEVLQLCGSSYFPSLNKVISEVQQQREETGDNVRFLRPLTEDFEKLNVEAPGRSEFEDLGPLFKKILHSVFLIWKNSIYYNKSSRLVVLIREICNDLIEQARVYVDPKNVFQVEPSEAVSKLGTVVRICGLLKEEYSAYKAKVDEEVPENPWKFHTSTIFQRLDSFLERIVAVQELCKTFIQFSGLEKIEIGGTKGRSLTAGMRSIHSEFVRLYQNFKEVKYDVLNVEDPHFDADINSFRDTMDELERRVGSILTAGFEDCNSIDSRLKLIESFDILLEKPIIRSDFEKKQADLLLSFGRDLSQVYETFLASRANPPVFDNYPPTAGALAWVQGLRHRVDEPMHKLQQVCAPVLDTADGKEIIALHASITRALNEYEMKKYDDWAKEVGTISVEKLQQPLLFKDASAQPLRVNFDDQLTRLLREVHYLEKLNESKPAGETKFAIPEEALSVFQKADVYRSQTGSLGLITSIYNNMVSSLLPVERPLIQRKLTEIDNILQNGITTLSWKDDGIDDFIANALAIVNEQNNVVNTLKANITAIKKILESFEQNLIFQRFEAKTLVPDVFGKRYEEIKAQRFKAIRQGSDAIHAKMDASLKQLGDSVTVDSSEWKNYVNYANKMVIDGICQTVNNNLRSVLDQIDAKPSSPEHTEAHPFFEVTLSLEPSLDPERSTVFNPALDKSGASYSIKGIVASWITDFISVARLVKSLDGVQGDYSIEVDSNKLKKELVDSINARVSENLASCREFRSQFLSFSFLWTTDIRTSFKKFMTEEATKIDGVISDPPLAKFENAIVKYKKILEKISQLPDMSNIGWLRIDCRPMKSALSATCFKWKASFSDFLSNKVRTNLDNLYSFMHAVDTGIDEEPHNDEVLRGVMGHIRDVRFRMAEIEQMFEPAAKISELLSRHDAQLPDELLKKIEESPNLWKSIKNKAMLKREKLGPLQDKEAKKIKDQMLIFNEKVRKFRSDFNENAPFQYNVGVDKAYKALDKWNKLLSDIEIDAGNLRNLQELFELTVSQYKDLVECREEIEMLKQLWDMTSHVMAQFREWMKTSFKKVDVDFLTDECKKLTNQIKQFPTKMRFWDAYTGLSSQVKNMLTALPLVQDLRNDSMRPRHWKQLLHETKKSGNINPDDENFSLQQLLDLGLHAYVDEVGTIVDKANKELKIENSLTKIADGWVSQQFTFVENEELKCPVLGSVDEIIELLEDNQVQLNGMATSRFVEYFINQVSQYQRTLATVDSIITLWIEVQHSWANLYPIFILSADIRVQLPEDSKRFEIADSVWRDLMNVAKDVPNVIEACTKDTVRKKLGKEKDIGELLDDMKEAFEKCEKSLADYLETKRRAFPRFYFVAPADLVDILSKGSYPHQVMKHMNKLADGIETLVFDGESKLSKGLLSKEGEELEFYEPYECEGAVENWLNGVLDNIKDTLNHVLAEAHSSYVEQPRDKWLFNYPAQIVIVVSRIWWTTEVNAAFDKLEESNDEGAIKEYNKQQVEQLERLTTLVQGKLSSGDRRKIITLITVDVHNRDIVQKLIDEKVENAQAFTWQSQLRYSWDDKHGCMIDIADAQFKYDYEYIGNCGCLVITPLTDRCYITLTQALRLVMGGAPAGPAGTGKTETTKDLARALGKCCYVFNCTEQMDYLSLGNIFKGLCQSGAWGCFDEFNRISVNVLSVVATQFKSILDAIKKDKTRFMFQGEEIRLIKTCGVFITMNPGYKGRTELPENLKALFRPCAMVVPDLMNICEIMLASEGFKAAKMLAKKFVMLYALNRDLLSKQDHYDWGLRAIKSVLVIAGGLKRSEPDIPEDKILMRALRDTNLAKLSCDDIEIFKGLIVDLFPKMELPPKRNPELENCVRAAAESSGLQLGENEMFVLKIIQFKELLDVRHSVFVLGPAGAGKTAVWQTLAKALTSIGQKTTCHTLDPKAVSSNELYGYINPVTREWKDGLLSHIMRELSVASKSNKNPKWIILDGDIDTEWIESMNTVMDDNKVLTLASNERIPLTDSMRMVFEISHLKNASPATVSRAGILFLNETDIGWGPFKDSWIERREDEREKQNLERLFEKYAGLTIDFIRKSGTIKHIIPISDFSMIQTVCYLLEGLLTKDNAPHGSPNDVYETYFVFACIWACGGAFASDVQSDNKLKFSNWWKKTFTAPVKFPEQGTVFDYYISKAQDGTLKLSPWQDIVPDYIHKPEVSWGNIVVHTADTVRLTYVMNLLTDNPVKPHPVLLVGIAGTSKTTIVREKLKNLSDDVISNVINFNSNTDSLTLQLIMEQSLEKKAGVQYGPPGRKKAIYFVDDLNMPKPDKYNTQSAISFMRQALDYSYWYDRAKMSIRKVSNIQFIAAMNPKAGSFTVDDRLQRHFGIFACSFPRESDLRTIYNQVMSGVFEPFNKNMFNLVPRLVNSSIDLHQRVSKRFVPTAIKFHYQFNLRELSNIFQGLAKANKTRYTQTTMMIRLWIHECRRVFSDRLVSMEDIADFDELLLQTTKKHFEDEKQDELFKAPIVFSSFVIPAEGNEEPPYMPAPDYETLKNTLNLKLSEYNEQYAVMPLELFEQAIEHICRISRIISTPRGNALLVGVGGSGKQSLTRLASFINGYDTYQITVTSKYGINEFKTDLMELYRRTGIKGQTISFLITDSQIVESKMLVYVNDLLSSGYIPDLFSPDDKDGIIGSITNEVKQAGLDFNSREVCWDYFIDKVRNNLHLVLCFSPVGQQFRIWCRQYPAITSCTVIDWFHGWPEEALISVAKRFLKEIELGSEAMHDTIANYMATVHFSVNDASKNYLVSERRYNYTTPKSFLELIALFKSLLARKRDDLESMIERLETGLSKLKESAEKVAYLQVVLQEEQVIVEEKKVATEELVAKVGKESLVVKDQAAIASVEESKTNQLVAEVESFAEQCRKDLEEAEPLVQAAIAALNTLDKNSITELRGFTKPANEIVDVCSAVMLLTADPKKPLPKDLSWNASKKMMGQVQPFLDSLINFDRENIPLQSVKAVEPFIQNPNFNADYIRTKSVAAAGLCSWVTNMIAFHEINLKVEPKRQKKREAEERLEASRASLKRVQAQVAALQEKLNVLLQQFEKAKADKIAIEEQAERTQLKLELAGRLVNGLADEKVRWAESIEKLKVRRDTLVGDVLLAASFLSYIGAFSRKYRQELLFEKWIPEISRRAIPTTEGIDPIYGVLTDEATIAQWNNEGLPSDRISVENGTIVVESTRRWPLLIDPQLQGVKWIKNREAKNGLKVVQLSQPKFLDVIEDAISNGFPVLIENLGETIDAILEPVLARKVFKKGRTLFIKLGDKEVEYDEKRFRLYLQTKMSNPHYRPEIAAQTTLINFMVTEDGLEDQLLAVVVNKERPDLERQRVKLLRELNQFKIDIKDCEDSLLYELTNAKGDILENRKLIENLEETKRKSKQIKAAVELATETQKTINENREIYRSAAVRGSLLYFQIDQLSAIGDMYQYSLESFMTVFVKALVKSPTSNEITERVQSITDCTTQTLFDFVSRGLFERHKLIFATMVCIKILQKRDALDPLQLNFLLRGPKKFGVPRPDDVATWCSQDSWDRVQALTEIEGTNPPFSSLPEEMNGSWRRWKQWCELEKPEDEKLPLEWKNLTSFQRLLVIRCLRPDRTTMAVAKFVAEQIGKQFIEAAPVDLEASFQDSSPLTPIFFILSPGVDPVKAVESMGRKYKFTEENGKFMNISLGQGQEKVAEAALHKCFKKGGWVMLNNIHLTVNWLQELEKTLDKFTDLYAKSEAAAAEESTLNVAAPASSSESSSTAPPVSEDNPVEEHAAPAQEQTSDDTAENHSETAEKDASTEPRDGSEEQAPVEKAKEEVEIETGHPNFRLFLSAEPSEKIPLGILQRCIKLTNEPPQGLKANLVRAFMQFSEETWESSSKQSEFKAILFALCFFHSVVVERKKFGPQGWNRNYPFNLGDLTTCIAVLNNYLEDRQKIPWDDLRYIFGEIMYGGHIVDSLDRRLAMAYLNQYIGKELLEGMELCPKFASPSPSLSYHGFLEYIEEALPVESPSDFGLHPNAEIGFRTMQGENLFKAIVELQPRSATSSEGMTVQEKVKIILDNILRDLPERYPLQEILERIEEDRTPFQTVFAQECERMNILLNEIDRSLNELDLGLKGDLQMSDKMQALMDALFDDKVPESWAAVAYPSLRPLSSWLVNLTQRCQQLRDWTADLQLPKVVWLSGFFNPQSFLTAIMQTTARKNGWALDKMTLTAEVTKKSVEEFDSTTRDGAFIRGLVLEGASWDINAGVLDDAKLKELYPKMPVMLMKAVLSESVNTTNMYECPVYRTQERGPTFVFSCNLKTKQPASKWTLGGVALLLDIVE